MHQRDEAAVGSMTPEQVGDESAVLGLLTTPRPHCARAGYEVSGLLAALPVRGRDLPFDRSGEGHQRLLRHGRIACLGQMAKRLVEHAPGARHRPTRGEHALGQEHIYRRRCERKPIDFSDRASLRTSMRMAPTHGYSGGGQGADIRDRRRMAAPRPCRSSAACGQLPANGHCASSFADRTDGTFSRSDFTYDHRRDLYVCPGGKELLHYQRRFARPRIGVDAEGLERYRPPSTAAAPAR